MHPNAEKIFQYFHKTPDEHSSPIELPCIREDLPAMFRSFGFTHGAEIGVEQGEFSETLCKNYPELVLYCVDPWKAYAGYRDHVYQDKLDRFYLATKERLFKYGCRLVREFSMDAVKNFDNETFDFVYIDGNHNFQNCTNDICEWTKKVKRGGIIAGHDYRTDKWKSETHVADVVLGYTHGYKINPWFLTQDKTKTFLWVKQ